MAKAHRVLASTCVSMFAIAANGSFVQAQSSSRCTTPVALGALSAAFSGPRTGAPYTATVTTTEERPQPDGTVVHGAVTTSQARDAAGREWQRRSLGCQPSTDGIRHPAMQIMVDDPATGTSTSWKEDDPAKILHVIHGKPRSPQPGEPLDDHKEAAAREAMEQIGIHAQSLGSRTIAGIVADGTRTEQVIPAGRQDTGQSVKTVREIWTTSALDLQLLNIEDNPKTGQRRTEVIDLKQGAPDPHLFDPPAGYTVAANPSAR